MSETGVTDEGAGPPTAASGSDRQPGTVQRPKLRRRPFGYKPADVDEALGVRDTELAELRQDVAALWLAFAQHDRMIRSVLDSRPPAPMPSPAPPPSMPPGPVHGDDSRPTPGADAASDVATSDDEIGRQLADLDEVLAAIELATQTLERTYTDEIQDEVEVEDEKAPRRDAENEV